MASSVSTEKFRSRNKVEMFDHDPDATAATVCTGGGWKDLRDYFGFFVAAMASALTGSGLTKVEIVASDSSDGSTNVTVVKDSGTIAADAVGDQATLECTAEELAQLSSDNSISPGLRYVAARLTMQNAADEAVVTYIRHSPRFPQTGLTPATTIA
jgi:hypothetical protein